MTGHRVKATLSLVSSDAGGLGTSLPSGTRSLLVRVTEPAGGIVDLGTAIVPLTGGDLVPGSSDVAVELLFWADEARIYATPGTRFVLWYGRDVGGGTVVSVVDEPSASRVQQ
jgi:hypothetical protein